MYTNTRHAMIKKTRRLLMAGLSLCLALNLAVPTFATSYEFDGEDVGENFHQSTSTDQDANADNGQIVVGMDGTVGSGTTGNLSSGPLSTIENLPVGTYPDAYGFYTDVDIANNSVFPNELGPTTQNHNTYTPTFTPTVSSGSLPTGNSYVYSPWTAISAACGGTVYGVTINPYSGYIPLAAYNTPGVYNNVMNVFGAKYAGYGYGNGMYPGLATAAVPMPALTSNGAIARLSIPAVGLNRYIYEGTTTESMNKGIGHFESTSGWMGNIGLCGHNRGNHPFFYQLKDVEIGDKVTYTTAYGTLTYIVSNITVVSVNDTSGLLQDGTNKITMYSCIANQPDVRLCVVATLVG